MPSPDLGGGSVVVGPPWVGSGRSEFETCDWCKRALGWNVRPELAIKFDEYSTSCVSKSSLETF